MCTDYFTIPEITISFKDPVKASERKGIYCANSSYEIFRSIYEDCMQHHEELWVMLLNQANKVLGVSQISKSGITSTMADIRIIMQTALKSNAVGLILSHNHPSGNMKPSQSDILLTEKIKKACDIMDIRLLDHLIVTDETFYSFAEEGLI